MGVYAHGNEYAEFLFTGSDIRLQDPYHIFLKQRLGMMVTFADKSQFAPGAGMLALHGEWELNYWRQHAAKAESTVRNDLSGGRSDLRVTEITLTNAAGTQTKVYTVALAAKDGVFVLSIAPVESSIDPLVVNIASSFKMVHRPLDPDEVKQLSMAAASAKP
jgi:hypothetical protein